VSTIGRTGVLVHAMMHVSAMPAEVNRWRYRMPLSIRTWTLGTSRRGKAALASPGHSGIAE
jgi:hypothetical protein